MKNLRLCPGDSYLVWDFSVSFSADFWVSFISNLYAVRKAIWQPVLEVVAAYPAKLSCFSPQNT